jgi:PEP-CTERM motif
MTKRSFFLAVAAGLLASVAFATPSQAGSEYLVTAAFNIVPLTGAPPVTATDVTVTLSDATLNGSVSVVGMGGLSTVSGTLVNGVVTINFDAASATTPTSLPGGVMVEFSGPTGVGINAFALSGTSAAFSSSGLNVSIANVSVPEPTSVALLGIGMTGFLAFRRLFKRSSVA